MLNHNKDIKILTRSMFSSYTFNDTPYILFRDSLEINTEDS